MTTTPSETCGSCGAPIRQSATYCRECGETNLNATVFRPQAPRPVQPPLLTPRNVSASRPATPGSMAARAQVTRRPRWILGTFWAFWTVVILAGGIVGPAKWLILVAIATGAYSVYLYRGGRFGFMFF